MAASRSRNTGGVALLASAAAACVVVLTPSAASATPPIGVSGIILGERTIGSTDYVVRRITVQPGGTTGWHWHDGTLYAVVKSGTLTRQMSDCTTIERHPPGDGLIEKSGPDHVHRGVNNGLTPVVLDVLYVKPRGAALSQDAADPGCSDPQQAQHVPAAGGEAPHDPHQHHGG